MTKAEYDAYRERRFSTAERREICMFEISACRMMEAAEALERKTAGYKYLRRDLGAIKAAYNRILDYIGSKADPDDIQHIRQYSAHCSLELAYMPNKRAAQAENPMKMFSADDVLTLVNTALNEHCAICVNDDKQCRKCKIRKALKNIVPEPDFENNLTPCGFANLKSRSDI